MPQRHWGLPVKLHADQLSNLGGAALADRFRRAGPPIIWSTATNAAARRALAKAGTVAVLLPGAFYFIAKTRGRRSSCFRSHGVKMALATDCNPGSSR